MEEGKTNILQTVIEDLNGPIKGKGRSGGSVSNQSGKVSKNGRSKKTKKVIVKLPSMNKRFENEHKIFPKGIESVRRSLEEIKEEAREGRNEEEQMQTNGVAVNVDVSAATEEETHASLDGTKEQEEENKENEEDKTNKSNGDPIYGMFTRTNTERSLLSNKSDSILIVSQSASKKTALPKRPRTSNGWSKKDLDIFLPKKSFFSVHDNTLSAAGFDVRSEEERKRPEWRKFLNMHTLEELYPKEDKQEEKPVPVITVNDDESEEDFSLDNVETAISVENKDSGTGSKHRRRTQKKSTSNEKEEYKPLYDYLKCIHDNPEEYIQQTKYTGKNVDYKHPSLLVRLGRAFRRGHHGAYSQSIYLHAISNLKPKLTETTGQRNTRGDKGVIKKETGESTEQTNQDETELQKLKSKAENWMKGITTQQWLKAKELALKDVGDEDINITKWWLAFKSCHYLRIPPHFNETMH